VEAALTIDSRPIAVLTRAANAMQGGRRHAWVAGSSHILERLMKEHRP